MTDLVWWQDFSINPNDSRNDDNVVSLVCPKDDFYLPINKQISIREIRTEILNHLRDPEYVQYHK
jgi:hypothetical protein